MKLKELLDTIPDCYKLGITHILRRRRKTNER